MWDSENIIWTVSWKKKEKGKSYFCYGARSFSNPREARGFAKYLMTKPEMFGIIISSKEEWRKE